MFVTPSGIVTLVNFAAFIPNGTNGAIRCVTRSQPSKAPSPMLVTLVGISMVVRPLHPENANAPILVTPSGITTLVRPLQPENALSPMLVTESGIVTLVRPLQPENALSPMLVTESGIVTLVRPLQPWNASFPICVTVSGTMILVSSVHPLNAELTIVLDPGMIVTFVMLEYVLGKIVDTIHRDGIATSLSLPQPWNASSPILVTESGIVKLANSLQPENTFLCISFTGYPSIIDGITTAPEVCFVSVMTAHPSMTSYLNRASTV